MVHRSKIKQKENFLMIIKSSML